MLSSLRARILAVAVAVIVLALAINGVASYVTVKSHNDNQVAYNLNAVARGNGQAITGWVATRSTMLASVEAAVEEDDPFAALIQLETSGDFMATYIVDADSGQGIFSDRWVPPSDYDPRDRPWYLQAVDMGETTITPPYVDATDATANDLVVTFSRPFYRNGNLAAVVAGDIAIGDVTAIVETIAPTPSSFAFLATADGTLVAHPDPALSLSPTTALSPELDAEFLARLAEESKPQRMELDGRGVLLQGLPIGAGSDWQLVIVLDEDEATAGLRAILGTSTITLLLVALGAAVLLGTLLKVMFRRLQAARDAMENIASGNGDLTRRLPQDGSDEVAQLAASFNRFVAKMEEVLLEVRDSSETVRSAASEIALGGQDLSRRTDSSASSLQQTSASMEEITGTVENTAASAREANQLSLSASQVASRGGEVVSQVVSTMGEITEASRRIGEIVTLMDGIAFQTNLLALNASVEAARAGEQGRGFAVVASEVRQLASRSADAAREIRGLIEASGEKVDAGTRLVHTAGETMQEIVASISRVTEVLGEISTAANEQSDGIGQVNVAVVELDRMVQENAALVEESTVAAEQLQEHSVRLAEAVGGFTLSGHQLTDQRADQGIQRVQGI